MPAEKSIGIVLRVVEFSETSCVVTLYTRDFGKMTALAKGARRLKSPFEGAIDLLANCRIVFLRKSGDSLDLLTEAKLIRRFRSSSTDLARYYAGLYVIELVSALTDHADPQPELFDLVEQVVATIDHPQEATSLTIELLRFEMQLLALLGHIPSLVECVGCGSRLTQAVNPNDRIGFGLLAGGVFCDSCRAGKRSVVGLRYKSLELMRLLAAPQGRPVSAVPEESVLGELRGLLDQYFSDLIGYRPRMQSWLKEAFRQNI